MRLPFFEAGQRMRNRVSPDERFQIFKVNLGSSMEGRVCSNNLFHLKTRRIIEKTWRIRQIRIHRLPPHPPPHARCSHDPSLISLKADAYITELCNQHEAEKAQYDASSITAEQTCSLLEQKYVSLKTEFGTLQSQHSQLSSTLEERVSEAAQIQADKHQIYLQSIGKDGEFEKLSLEVSELQKSKSQLLQLIEHKDLEINEKSSSIKGYLDKIVSLTDSAFSKDSRIIELEAEHARVHTSMARLTQEKELVERQNLWLNDELTTKVNNLLELRKVHNELEADMSSKLADLERKYNETSSSSKWKDDKIMELESKIEVLQIVTHRCV